MRIISGTKKRTILYGPDTKTIRPTTDRAKEALFNIINTKVIDSHFLDLFSGSGSIALEAKSRGASSVFAIDKSLESEKLINKNINKTKLNINYKNTDVVHFINNTTERFDIIFLDPPFNKSDEEVIEILDLIIKKNILNPSGVVILERMSNINNEQIFSKYNDIQIRKYGKVTFIIMES